MTCACSCSRAASFASSLVCASSNLALFCFQLRIFLLELLIFRAGNGHHFFRVACLHFSVFHANIMPQNAAKSQCFQWFPPIFPCSGSGQSRYRAVGLRLLDLQPLHEPAVLLRR